MTFLNNLLLTNNAVLHTLFNTVANLDVAEFASKFQREENDFKRQYRHIVHNNFKSELGL